MADPWIPCHSQRTVSQQFTCPSSQSEPSTIPAPWTWALHNVSAAMLLPPSIGTHTPLIWRILWAICSVPIRSPRTHKSAWILRETCEWRHMQESLMMNSRTESDLHRPHFSQSWGTFLCMLLIAASHSDLIRRPLHDWWHHISNIPWSGVITQTIWWRERRPFHTGRSSRITEDTSSAPMSVCTTHPRRLSSNAVVATILRAH